MRKFLAGECAKEPFEYLNGGHVPPRAFCGIQELPKVLADLAIEADCLLMSKVARQLATSALSCDRRLSKVGE